MNSSLEIFTAEQAEEFREKGRLKTEEGDFGFYFGL
jgi:hypothetical protein